MKDVQFGLSDTAFGRFLLPVGDLISDSIARGEGWDLEIMPLIEAAGRLGGVAVDAGANLGFFSVQCASRFERVHAFEPQPMLYYNLCANLMLNGCSNVTAHAVALSDRRGGVSLAAAKRQDIEIPTTSTGDVDYTAFSNYGAVAFDKGKGALNIPALPIDAFRLNQVKFVKVDCQGMDLLVLKGAIKTIQGSRPLVVFETERALERDRKISRTEYLDLFYPLDYEFRILRNHENGKQLNVSAFPRESSDLFENFGWEVGNGFDN